MARLPDPGGDAGDWGTILNDFLTQSLNADGTIKDAGVVADKVSKTGDTMTGNLILAQDVKYQIESTFGGTLNFYEHEDWGGALTMTAPDAWGPGVCVLAPAEIYLYADGDGAYGIDLLGGLGYISINHTDPRLQFRRYTAPGIQGSTLNIGANSSGFTMDASLAVTGQVTGHRTISTQAVDTTLALADDGTIMKCTKSTAQAITIPLNATIPFPLGTQIELLQYGAGAVTATPVSGTVVIRGTAVTTAQYKTLQLTKIGTNEWLGKQV